MTTKNRPLNEKQAAEKLGLSVFWMRRKRWEGGGPVYRKMGTGSRAPVKYLESDLDDFINARRRSSTSEAWTENREKA